MTAAAARYEAESLGADVPRWRQVEDWTRRLPLPSGPRTTLRGLESLVDWSTWSGIAPMEQIAERAGCSLRSVQRHVRPLVDLGVVRRTERVDRDGATLAPAWTIDVERLRSLAEGGRQAVTPRQGVAADLSLSSKQDPRAHEARAGDGRADGAPFSGAADGGQPAPGAPASSDGACGAVFGGAAGGGQRGTAPPSPTPPPLRDADARSPVEVEPTARDRGRSRMDGGGDANGASPPAPDWTWGQLAAAFGAALALLAEQLHTETAAAGLDPGPRRGFALRLRRWAALGANEAVLAHAVRRAAEVAADAGEPAPRWGLAEHICRNPRRDELRGTVEPPPSPATPPATSSKVRKHGPGAEARAAAERWRAVGRGDDAGRDWTERQEVDDFAPLEQLADVGQVAENRQELDDFDRARLERMRRPEPSAESIERLRRAAAELASIGGRHA